MDYPRVKRFFLELTGESPQEIIRQLSDAGKK
jgi:hypothetical protein